MPNFGYTDVWISVVILVHTDPSEGKLLRMVKLL